MDPKLAHVQGDIDKVRHQHGDIVKFLKQHLSNTSTRSKSAIKLSDVLNYLEAADSTFEYISTFSSEQESRIASNIANSIKEHLKPANFSSASYAYVARESQSEHNNQERHLPKFTQNPPANKNKVIIVTSKDTSTLTAKAVQTKIKLSLNSKSKTTNKHHQLNIKSTFPTSKGIGVVCGSEKTLDELIKKIKDTTDDINTKCEYKQAMALLPTVVLQDVNKEMIDFDTIKEELAEKNDINIDDIKGYFVLNNNKQHSLDICLRVTPELFQIIAKRGFKLYIGIQQCRLRRRVFVDQCQCCFGYGHTTKYCNNKPEHHICVTCGKSEDNHECSEELCCYNCENHQYFKETAHNHKPNSMDCPLYRRRHDRIENRTQYHPTPTV